MSLTLLPFRKQQPIERRSKRASRLGVLAGLLSLLQGRRPITSVDLKQHDFPISTQRLGVRFTEHIRDAFRGRWIRLHNGAGVHGGRRES